jgi:hypothetical protein
MSRHLESIILPVLKFENRLGPLVSPDIYRKTGPPG